MPDVIGHLRFPVVAGNDRRGTSGMIEEVGACGFVRKWLNINYL